jgi:hypothetical protein
MGANARRGAAVLGGFALVLSSAQLGWSRPPISIRTSGNTADNGYLEIQPDEFGAWAADFTTGGFGPNADRFKPSTSTLQVTGFTSGFFIFGPGGQRELLTDNAQWQATTNGAGGPPFSADTTMGRSVTSPNVASDSNSDGINDTLNSAFRVFAPVGTDLAFQLRQRVSALSPGVSLMQQDYSVTNNGTAPISFNMVRNFDGDLLWTGDFSTDSVGTSANGTGQTYVTEMEVGQPTQAVTLFMPEGEDYYGGKNGVVPGGGPPAYNFGTDTEIWDVNGIPASWNDHIAGVGYSTNGQSGASPPGSVAPRDAFMGMDITITLNPGQSDSFVVYHTYGSDLPIIPEPATAGMALVAAAGLLLRRR